MDAGKKVGVILAVGLAAAATGIVVVAAIAQWHERRTQDQRLVTRLRDVQDVLSDCDSKLREIERHLPQIVRHSVAEANSARIAPQEFNNTTAS